MDKALLDSDNPLPEDLVSELDRLAAYAGHRSRAVSQRFWTLALLLPGIAGVVAFVLLWWPESGTTFSAEISATSFQFRSAGEIRLRHLTAHTIHLGGFSLDPPETGRDGAQVRDSTSDEGIRLNGPLSVESVTLSPGTEVHVSIEKSSATLHLHIECRSGGQCGQGGISIVGLPGANREPGRQSSYRIMHGTQTEPSADVSVKLTRESPSLLFSDSDIDSLGLLDVRDTPSPTEANALVWSGVQGGQVRLPGVDRTIQLESGDWLRLQARPLRVTSVTMTDSGFVLRFRGVATVLEAASSGYSKSLKPSRLEIVASSRYKVLITALSVGLGLLVVLGRLLRSFWGAET